MCNDAKNNSGQLSQQLQAQLHGAGSLQSNIDTRSLGKPQPFPGADEDWDDFSSMMRSYCGAQSPIMLKEMEQAEASDRAIVNLTMSDQEQGRSVQL